MLNSMWLKRERAISNILFSIVLVMHTSVVLLGGFISYKIYPGNMFIVPLIISVATIYGLVLLVKSHLVTLSGIDKTIATFQEIEAKNAKNS